jgi:BirA family biotin operon repressor/biotin-[acetyl-CoA-carboxylase] ligase
MIVMEVQRIHFTEIDSTNSWAKEHADEFDPKKLTCITADIQTAGRGRFRERRWVSKKGNLHMSLFLAIPADPNLGQILAFTAAQVVDNSVQIKWPNDLIANGKKLCGVLVEIVAQGAVLGIGMNVNAEIKTDQPTTSLKELSGRDWNLEELAEAICKKFLENWKKGFAAIRQDFESLLAYKNQHIVCTTGEGNIRGILLGITKTGHLQMQMNDEKVLEISSGEIQKVRPVD